MPLEDEFERKFRLKVRCPWPGPRPLSLESPISSLIGRSGAVTSLLGLVRETDVLVVTGRSGVGKTSLLNAGLMPALHRAGFRVVSIDPGQAIAPSNGPLELLTHAVRDELGLSAGDDLDELLGELEDIYPNRVVIFLDQFEELLRQRRPAASRVLRGVEALASNTSIRFVLSIRSEYEHQLSGRLGMRPGAYRRKRYEVLELTERGEFTSIVSSANEIIPFAIDKKFTAKIVDLWMAAIQSDEEVGLLDLQAFLFCLWLRRSDDVVGHSSLEGFEHDIEGRYKGQGLIAAAIPEAVKQSVMIALDIAQDMTRRKQLNVLQTSNAIMCIREMSKHLGSGGYKVASERRKLAAVTLSGMARQLREDQISFASPALRRLEVMADQKSVVDALDWLTLPRIEYGVNDQYSDGWPWQEDEQNLTSGPVLGKHREIALFEYYRSFLLGLKLLVAAGVVRTISIAADEHTVTLVHDRFAAGLQLWSEGLAQDLADVAARPIAVEGGHFEIADIGDSARLIVNLRWLHGTFTGKIRNTLFVNCDFTGTRFDHCEFEGVTFANCILDDVLIQSSTIIGGTKSLRGGNGPDKLQKLGELPTFRVIADAPYISALSWYESRLDTANCLLSLTGGMPAVTAVADRCEDAPELIPEAVGISIHGGRISGFKMRASRFQKDGRLRLSGVAGTSIEFADQHELTVEIIGCALRGLAFTSPLDKEPSELQPAIALFADNSILVDVWLGRGFVGDTFIFNCRVWHLMNASRHVNIKLENSPYHSLVNVGQIEDSEEEGFERDSLGDMGSYVDDVSSTIDYREHPVGNELTTIYEWLRRSGQTEARSRQPSVQSKKRDA